MRRLLIPLALLLACSTTPEPIRDEPLATLLCGDGGEAGAGGDGGDGGQGGEASGSGGEGGASGEAGAGGSSGASGASGASGSGGSGPYWITWKPCPLNGPCIVLGAGDSLTDGGTIAPGGWRPGFWANSVARNRWVQFVGSRVKAPNDLVALRQAYNEGYPGKTVGQLASTDALATSLFTSPPTSTPAHVVVVIIGTNNASGNVNLPAPPAPGDPIPTPNAGDDLLLLCDRIWAWSPQAVIVVSRKIPPTRVALWEQRAVTLTYWYDRALTTMLSQGKRVIPVNLHDADPEAETGLLLDVSPSSPDFPTSTEYSHYNAVGNLKILARLETILVPLMAP